MFYARGAQQRFRNENMVICMAGKISYERIAEELNTAGYWKSVTGFQNVDYNRRYAIVLSHF